MTFSYFECQICIFLSSCTHLPIMFLLVRMTKASQVHLHIIVRICTSWLTSSRSDSFRPQETESRQSSALLIKQSLVCVSLCLVSSLKSQTLCQTVYCAGVTPKKTCLFMYILMTCVSFSECHYKRFYFNATKNIWQIFEMPADTGLHVFMLLLLYLYFISVTLKIKVQMYVLEIF